MTFGQIENFIAVVEAGSFSAAAEKRYISPQALIQQIAKMEQELGFRLLIRSSKGVRLSAAGEEYYRGVSTMLNQYKTCVELASKKAETASILRIGLPANINSAFMMSVCRRFTEKYPHVQLRYENYFIQDTAKAIEQGRVDIGAQIRGAGETPYHSIPLFPVHHFCLVTRNHPLAKRSSLSVSDLVGCTVGVWGPLSAYSKLSDYIAKHRLDIRLRSLPEEFSKVLIFCIEGNVLLTSTPVISYLQDTLLVLPIDFDFEISYYLSYMDEDSEVVQQFLAVAKDAAASEAHPWKQTHSGLQP